MVAAEIVYYAARELVRNAARHGRGVGLDRPLSLRVAIAWHDGLEIVVVDDGVGLSDRDDTAGGQGLALHSTMLAVVGGTLTVDSAPGRNTRATISLPEGVETTSMWPISEPRHQPGENDP